MIKFFRKIRQNLLSEGKTGKYLKYAIGEIVLVVIGILIALSINNWNEDQKAINKEKLILQEFKTSINKDLLGYDENYVLRLERKKSGLDSLLYYMKNNHNIHDSLFKKFYGMMSSNIKLTHDGGPYEALKSSGLYNIKNDSLRTAINRTYINLMRWQLFSHNTDAENNTKISELENKVSNIKTFEYQGDRIFPMYEIKVDKIITNQDFLQIYHLQLRKYNTYIHRLGQMKSALMELKAKIDEELKK